jgi:uncharacterized protein (TIGR03067 family)
VEITNQGIGIHHALFGKVVKEKMDALGIPCELYAGGKRIGGGTPMRTIDFLMEHLGIERHAEDRIKKEMLQLEGEWSMASGVANGQSMPKEAVKTGKRIAKDGKTAITIGGRVLFKASFTIDPKKNPKAIDYAMTEGPTKGKTHLGIYELDGDTVKFCFAAPGMDRPSDFTAPKGSQRTFSVWKRTTMSQQ